MRAAACAPAGPALHFSLPSQASAHLLDRFEGPGKCGLHNAPQQWADCLVDVPHQVCLDKPCSAVQHAENWRCALFETAAETNMLGWDEARASSAGRPLILSQGLTSTGNATLDPVSDWWLLLRGSLPMLPAQPCRQQRLIHLHSLLTTLAFTESRPLDASSSGHECQYRMTERRQCDTPSSSARRPEAQLHPADAHLGGRSPQ